MKHVLILTPTFLPKTSADMHRVRMMLPHLKNCGWRATVLAAKPSEVIGPDDPLLETLTGNNYNLVHYTPFKKDFWEQFGLRNLGWRSAIRQAARGSELLAQEKYDCILFSSTMFASWRTAPHWHKKFNIPYILNFQDPWWRFTPRSHKPPGHPFKAFFARWIARVSEPAVVKNAAGLIVVSPAYKSALLERYPEIPQEKILHVPFSGSRDDFSLLDTVSIKNVAFDCTDDYTHLVYIGRLGDDMIPALNALFRSFASYLEKEPEKASRVRFHFIGTSYAATQKEKLYAIPIASNWRLLDYVLETPERVPYLEALRMIKDAHGILVLGSTDSSYSPSKLFPALLSEKPILCVAAKDSLLSSFVASHNVPAVVWDYTYSETNKMLFERFLNFKGTKVDALPTPLLELALADRMTKRICDLMDSCIHK